MLFSCQCSVRFDIRYCYVSCMFTRSFYDASFVRQQIILYHVWNFLSTTFFIFFIFLSFFLISIKKRKPNGLRCKKYFVFLGWQPQRLQHFPIKLTKSFSCETLAQQMRRISDILYLHLRAHPARRAFLLYRNSRVTTTFL